MSIISDAPSLRESPKPRQAMALADSHGAISEYFIIVHEPGRSPDKKRPPVPTSDGADRMMCELLNCRPTARLTLASLTWNHDLWVDDGHESLGIRAVMAGLPLPDGGRASIRLPDRGAEVWLRAAGQRRVRKAGGPYATMREAVSAICGPIWTQAVVSARKDGSSQLNQPPSEATHDGEERS